MTEREAQLVSRDEKIKLLEECIQQLKDTNDGLNAELRDSGDRIESIQKDTEERIAQFGELRIQLEKVEFSRVLSLPPLPLSFYLATTLSSTSTRFCITSLTLSHSYPQYNIRSLHWKRIASIRPGPSCMR